MTNYAYKRDIPAANHNPAVDQPDMKTNTNSTGSLIGEDHYTFGVANGGFHKQIRLPDLAAIGNLAPRIANSGTLWTQKAISTGVTEESDLFYVPDLTSDSYQLTRTITASKALFAANTQNYNGVGAKFEGGWTFLPGGLLFQWGLFDDSSALPSTKSVQFPVGFSSKAFNIQITLVGPNSSFSDTQTIAVVGVSSTSFTVRVKNSTTNYTGFYWQAIGK